MKKNNKNEKNQNITATMKPATLNTNPIKPRSTQIKNLRGTF